jgi:hypothetical protein
VLYAACVLNHLHVPLVVVFDRLLWLSTPQDANML